MSNGVAAVTLRNVYLVSLRGIRAGMPNIKGCSDLELMFQALNAYLGGHDLVVKRLEVTTYRGFYRNSGHRRVVNSKRIADYLVGKLPNAWLHRRCDFSFFLNDGSCLNINFNQSWCSEYAWAKSLLENDSDSSVSGNLGNCYAVLAGSASWVDFPVWGFINFWAGELADSSVERAGRATYYIPYKVMV